MDRMVDEVQVINDHLKVEWMCDRRLVVYTVNSIKKEVIDAWSQKVIETMNALPAGQVYYSLHNYTGVDNFMTTPHLRQRSKENTLARPDLSAYTAIVIPKSVMSHITMLFVR